MELWEDGLHVLAVESSKRATASQRPPPAWFHFFDEFGGDIAAITRCTRVPSECIEKIHNVLLLLRIQRSEGLRSRLALSIVQRDRSRDISRAAIVQEL